MMSLYVVIALLQLLLQMHCLLSFALFVFNQLMLDARATYAYTVTASTE